MGREGVWTTQRLCSEDMLSPPLSSASGPLVLGQHITWTRSRPRLETEKWALQGQGLVLTRQLVPMTHKGLHNQTVAPFPRTGGLPLSNLHSGLWPWMLPGHLGHPGTDC